MRGYFGIGIYQSKNIHNIGTLWRSAHNFGANFMFVIGNRYKRQSSDTTKAWRSIPFFEFQTFDDFWQKLPKECTLTGVEQCQRSRSVDETCHDERTVYLLGAEDHGLPENIIEKCHRIVHIETPMCLNVSTAGSIIMYDRKIKQKLKALNQKGTG